MLHQNTNTALLLFSRRSQEESLIKNLLPYKSPDLNKRLTEKMINRSVAVADETGLPLYVWDERMQHGDNFGEKLGNAIEAIINKGYEKVIVIGSDCLHLTPQHILKAASALQTQDAVIAPTKKGGAYLIGLTKNSFNKKTFASIRWQSSFTYNDLINFYPINSVCQLPLLDDVNDFTDLKKQLLQLSNADPFRWLATSIIASIVKPFLHFKFQSSGSILHNLFGLKAPPSSLFFF